MPEKKNHHYIPQSILRRFSPDGRTISLYHLDSGQPIHRAAIRSQCSRGYYYGTDAALEDAFGETEGKFSAILADVAGRDYRELAFKEKIGILLFVHYQRLRTVSAAEASDRQMEALLKEIAATNPHTADLDPASYRIEFDNTQIRNLKAAGDATLLVADLEVKFLGNDRKTGFVLSDAGVARYNQFAENHPLFKHWPSYGGIASKGLQWFYPVSSGLCIAVFDPTTYAYGSAKTAACRPSSRDVQALNTLQALHARKCIYYLPERASDEDLRLLRRYRGKHPSIYDVEIVKSPPYCYPDGKIGQIVSPNSPEAHLGLQFNFSRVTDRNMYEGYDRAILPMRNPRLFDYVDQENRRRDAASKAGPERNGGAHEDPNAG
jgi:hypothetical protein